MDTIGRPNHIEDALVTIHLNQWFGWTDSKNKIYMAQQPNSWNTLWRMVLMLSLQNNNKLKQIIPSHNE